MFTDEEIYNIVLEGLARELIPQEVLDSSRKLAEDLLTDFPPDVLRRMAARKIESGASLEQQAIEYAEQWNSTLP